ncbi:hypothetical protein BD410DRAFT_792459 [Rickenella mellea]|uniref:Uncharacterized protein n=1 Tax=Rickenella mellea TaxID=50990 RepID=A0A4Y7PUW7_9AGAM|nr:hypothetical protein BD410DRAFT_792459 [Rickenella mellea]
MKVKHRRLLNDGFILLVVVGRNKRPQEQCSHTLVAIFGGAISPLTLVHCLVIRGTGCVARRIGTPRSALKIGRHPRPRLLPSS